MAGPSLMRAVLLRHHDAGGFAIDAIPRPAPAAGQVLVRVRASGVNPIDTSIRRGRAPYARPALPAVPGTDLAGVVESVGPGVTAFGPGDAVYGLTGGVRGAPGSLAEYAAVDARLLAPAPRNLALRDAAVLPLVALTAWEGLIDRARLSPGQRVLVLGGAGGVGHLAVQIARAHGAEVFATARGARTAIVQALGATAIDVNATSVADAVAAHTGGRGFDIVYDCIGGPWLDTAFEAVMPYGHVLSCAAFGSHALAPASLRCATLSGIFVLWPLLQGQGREHHGEILRELTRLVEAGQVRPIVDPRRFTLEAALEAHALVEQGGAEVKVVVDVGMA